MNQEGRSERAVLLILENKGAGSGIAFSVSAHGAPLRRAGNIRQTGPPRAAAPTGSPLPWREPLRAATWGRPYGGGGSPLPPLSRCARHLPLTGGVIPRPTAVRFFVAPDDPAGAGGCRRRKVVRGDSVDRGYLVCRPLIRHGLRPCHLPPPPQGEGPGSGRTRCAPTAARRVVAPYKNGLLSVIARRAAGPTRQSVPPVLEERIPTAPPGPRNDERRGQATPYGALGAP